MMGVMVAKRMREPVGDGTEPWHGTSSGYQHHRCGCARCRGWKAREIARYRATRRTL